MSVCGCIGPANVNVRILNEDYDTIDFDTVVDIVGISIMSMNAPRAYEISAGFRRRGVPVIAGGFHATLAPDEVLEHFDAVCVGDCEKVVVRMIEDLREGRLRGIYSDEVPDLGALPQLNRKLGRGGRCSTLTPFRRPEGARTSVSSAP